MEKLPFTLVPTLLAAVTLVSCVDPVPPPPPHFRPNPPFAPEPVSPEGTNNYTPDPNNPPTTDPNPNPAPNPPPQQPTTPGAYPVAQKSTKPNEVISPYDPYNVIDVTGFKSGDLARDPSNQKIFRVP